MEAVEARRNHNYLIEDGGYFVTVSHRELDQLVASLMHVAELDSDKEHRDALKGELKARSRVWLDSLYDEAGYDKYSGVQVGTKIINLQAAEKNQIEAATKVKTA